MHPEGMPNEEVAADAETEEPAADADVETEPEVDGRSKTLAELHDDIEAALFAAQDLAKTEDSESINSREKAIIVTKLEEALLWTKRAIEGP